MTSTSPAPDRRLVEMAAALSTMRDQKTALERELTTLNARLEAANAQLVETMETLALDSFRVAGLGLFYLAEAAYPQVTDAAALAAWLRAESLGDLVKETVHWQTLRALVAERLQGGLTAPAGVKVFHKTDVRVRMAGTKQEVRP